MFQFCKLAVVSLCLLAAQYGTGQVVITGRIIDVGTKEPVPGATIRCLQPACIASAIADATGRFELPCANCDSLRVSAAGYITRQVASSSPIISLVPDYSSLQEIVFSASRGEAIRRSEAPVAIAAISSQVLRDAKPASADQVLNKISGVNMVNLGNEQHQMSIRQPMTTKSLVLYLEDGMPIRTSGLFNHNALLEMNLAATKSIEVIKGPSSSLYGSEAIGGVVNFITLAPAAVPVARLSLQGNNIGYKRADITTGFTHGKRGLALSGYYAGKHNGFLDYSDYHKGIVTTQIDYRFSGKTSLSNSLTWLSYYSDMAGGIDSAMFASRSFQNQQTFTYRKVTGLRYRSTLTQLWNDRSKTTVSVLYRQNAIGQNPAYRIKDDYRRQGAVFIGQKDLAHGEINENSFQSYTWVMQHRQSLAWKNAVLTGGASIDLSPSTYAAEYIRIKKDTINKKYTGYQRTDSLLTRYRTSLDNYALFINAELSPVERLKIVASLRYDLFRYGFNNRLTPSAFSGSPDTINHFSRVSPKIGLTYNLATGIGVYVNYSEGFVPPQVTELYTGVKVPALGPSTFYNYEAGGWIALLKKRLSIDMSIYRLDGTNEIISVKLDDGSFANKNAGKTSHKGIEAGLNASARDISFRFSGAWSRHRFTEFIEKGISYNGNEMSNAPNQVYNAEIWYKPSFAKGLRAGAEWQHVGSYFTDQQNTARYKGYDVLNLRIGYTYKNVEVWMNVLNATDRYYSTITTKSSFGYSYQLAEPRSFNLGIACDFADLIKPKK